MSKSAFILVDPQPSFTDVESKYAIAPYAKSIYKKILSVSKFFRVIAVTSKIVEKDDFLNDLDRGILNFKNKVKCGLFNKKTDVEEDVFSSGYCDELEDFLNKNNVDQVFLAGPIGDKNVKETALDCSKKFKTNFVIDCVRYSDNINETLKILIDNNINILNSNDIIYFLNDDDDISI